MDQALVAVAGIVIGALLGGSGKYFTSRRDAWAEARASGLLLLADVRALREARLSDPFNSEASLGVKSWESHEVILAHFRRGSFPNGFKAPEWLALAACFARLERFRTEQKADRDDEWSKSVDSELLAAERLLAPFEADPPVLGYVVRTGVMSFSARIVTVIYAVVLGVWFYLEQKQIDVYSQGTYDLLHGWVFELAFVVVAVVLGFVVRRWWVVLALVGPLLTLGYLQATGFVSEWHDGTSPLSIPTFAQMLWVALLLLAGVGLRRVWVAYASPEQLAPKD